MPIASPAGAKHREIEVEIAGELRDAMSALGADRDQVVVVGHKGDMLYGVFRKLGAKSDLLGIVGSYGDTLPDEEVLHQLRRWNAGRQSARER